MKNIFFKFFYSFLWLCEDWMCLRFLGVEKWGIGIRGDYSVGLLKIVDIILERSIYDVCIRRDMKGMRKGYMSILKV